MLPLDVDADIQPAPVTIVETPAIQQVLQIMTRKRVVETHRSIKTQCQFQLVRLLLRCKLFWHHPCIHHTLPKVEMELETRWATLVVLSLTVFLGISFHLTTLVLGMMLILLANLMLDWGGLYTELIALRLEDFPSGNLCSELMAACPATTPRRQKLGFACQ